VPTFILASNEQLGMLTPLQQRYPSLGAAVRKGAMRRDAYHWTALLLRELC
jgi:hypothetical protein